LTEDPRFRLVFPNAPDPKVQGCDKQTIRCQCAARRKDRRSGWSNTCSDERPATSSPQAGKLKYDKTADEKPIWLPVFSVFLKILAAVFACLTDVQQAEEKGQRENENLNEKSSEPRWFPVGDTRWVVGVSDMVQRFEVGSNQFVIHLTFSSRIKVQGPSFASFCA